MTVVDDAIKKSKAYYCLGCGKCTAICPINARNPGFSPRLVVEQVLHGEVDNLINSGQLWSCLTCGLCGERCHSDVDFPLFVRMLRVAARGEGQIGNCSHGGAIQSISRIMASPNLKQDRLRWLDANLRTRVDSDVLFFVGCSPLLDPMFRDVGARPLDATRNSIRILNQLGVEPAVLGNERCCGHDSLWMGDLANFLKLAEHNLDEIRMTRASTLVTACPECYHTLKVEYPRHIGDLGVSVMHLAQFLSTRLSGASLFASNINAIATFHDPCRLGRFSDVFDEPRQVLSRIPGLQLVEMAHSRRRATCCGTHAWANCGAAAKDIQVERLREAGTTGADVLVTACPKCEIHLKCASRDYSRDGVRNLEVIDLSSLLAGALTTAMSPNVSKDKSPLPLGEG